MRSAADAGLAPKIWYANADDRILVTDFVEAKPLPGDAGPMLASAIRTLHSLSDFPKRWNYLDFVDGLIQRFRATQILPEHHTEDVFRRYAELTNVYPRDADLVASHNDLKPENILFDGQRVWLVDWEAASLNDRYGDLAIIANFFAPDDAREETLLTNYFGEPPNEYQRARFYLMRQIMHMAYATFLMVLGAASGGQIDPEAASPDFDDFHQRLLARQVDVATAEAKMQYGKVHFEKLRRNLRSSQFDDALARVAGATDSLEPSE